MTDEIYTPESVPIGVVKPAIPTSDSSDSNNSNSVSIGVVKPAIPSTPTKPNPPLDLGYKVKTYDSGLATYYYDFGNIANPYKAKYPIFDFRKFLGLLWNIAEQYFDGFSVYSENCDISIVFKHHNTHYVSYRLEIDWFKVTTEKKVFVSNMDDLIDKLSHALYHWYLEQNEFNHWEDMLYWTCMRYQLFQFLDYVISNFILGVFLGMGDDSDSSDESEYQDTLKPFKFHMPYEYCNHEISCGQLPFLYLKKKDYTR